MGQNSSDTCHWNNNIFRGGRVARCDNVLIKNPQFAHSTSTRRHTDYDTVGRSVGGRVNEEIGRADHVSLGVLCVILQNVTGCQARPAAVAVMLLSVLSLRLRGQFLELTLPTRSDRKEGNLQSPFNSQWGIVAINSAPRILIVVVRPLTIYGHRHQDGDCRGQCNDCAD